ncbi:MAG: oligosaccharide flippase family protein [Lachnospiraceae bacterium]
MSEKVKKSLVMQGSILALAGIISKIIGFLYRIPMANLMGNTGNGLYSVAFGIYNVALTLSSYSMPLAVSKLLSARLARNEYKNAHRMFVRALLFALLTGTLACLALSFGADALAGFYHKKGLERPLRVLAPTTFIVAVLGTCRGYFQGRKNMVPTAVSQVLEQIVNAIVSIVATAAFVASCPYEGEAASYGAMGGTMGTLAGAAAALIFIVFLLFRQRKNVAQELQLEDEGDEDSALMYKAILFTVLPVILSQTTYQIGYTIDDYVFALQMNAKGIAEEQVTIWQGIFNTQYNQLINLPVAIATAMAAATLPSVVASFAVKKYEEVQHKMDVVLKISMMIAIPSAVGLAVLADPILKVLFPGLGEYHSVGVNLLLTGSSAIIFYSLSTQTTSILQGCNRMRTPLIHSAISLVIHIFIITVLLYFTNLGVYALIIGNVTFPMLVSILNVISLRTKFGFRMEMKNTVVKPLASAMVMGIVTIPAYGVVSKLLGNVMPEKAGTICGLVAALVVACLVYFVMLGLLRAFRRDELAQLPLIGKRFKKKN